MTELLRPIVSSIRDSLGLLPVAVGMALEGLETGEPFKVMQTNAFAALEALPEHCVDLLNFDLPYESLEKHRAVGTTTRLSHSKKSSNDWFGVVKNDTFPDLFRLCHRVLKNNSHMYCWCDSETSFLMKDAAVAAGFKFWKPLVWDKVHFGMGYHYRAQYEFIMFFEKGKRKLNDLGIGDVIREKRIKAKGAYPAEKPVRVNEILTLQSTASGELVCDPFCGSSSAGVAAVKNGRRFLGFDVSTTANILSDVRLREAKAVREALGL